MQVPVGDFAAGKKPNQRHVAQRAAPANQLNTAAVLVDRGKVLVMVLLLTVLRFAKKPMMKR